MNATSIAQHVHLLGVQAKAASSSMAKASAAQKSQALRGLAKLLRSHTAALQVDNAKDIERAKASGLEAAMVDRLKLTPQVLETCAQGCEQLANMPDIIGDIIGMKEQPSGIRVGQMRVPIGVFGMVFEADPMSRLRRLHWRLKVATLAFCVAAQRRLIPTKRWRNWYNLP